MDLPQEVRFDGWTLLRQSGELLRDGSRIRLQTLPLRVLEELLSSPGELVPREQLIARLWPKGVVDFDTALNSAVRRLRTVLGDQADSPRYIETIPRRGYRFIGRVDTAVPTALEASGPAQAELLGQLLQPPRRMLPPRRLLVAAAALLVLAAVAARQSGEPNSTAALITADSAPTGPLRAAPPARIVAARAEERYQRGRHFFHRRVTGDLELARRHFEEAVAIDPRHAPAWVGLAGVAWVETKEGRQPANVGLEQTRKAAEQALALDPSLAEAHLRLALYYGEIGDRARSLEHRNLAAALEPDNVMVLGFAADHAWSEGHIDESLALMRRAVEAEPLSNVYRTNLAIYLYAAGRLDEMKEVLKEMFEVNPAANRYFEAFGLHAIHEGRFAEALELSKAWPREADRLQVEALALHGLGRHAESDAVLRTLIETDGERNPLRIAEVHAFRGDTEPAFEWLNVAAGQADGPGKGNAYTRLPPWLAPRLPLLRPLQADRRWDAWLESTRQLSAPPKPAHGSG
jgi:DNA-binding winged helix-turn-helix (wHTH) protein/tetratricopeptide (TPR) repeat protein